MQAHLRAFVFSLAALFYLAAGIYKASHYSADFIWVYAGARCLIHGCNPYVEADLEHQYFEAHGIQKLMGPSLWASRSPVYPPATLLAVSPFVLLPFRFAAVAWALLGGSALVVATAMLLRVTAKEPSWILTVLASVTLICGHYLLGLGNPATLACSFAAIGTLLFLLERNVPLGALLLTLSLAIKPQIAGPIILYLLVRGVSRRWAALSLAGGAAFLLAGILILEMHPGSRHWLPALRANIADSLLPGHSSDPTPAHGQLGMGLTNLQTLTSVFLANPRAWNAAAWGITLLLFVLWIGSIRHLKAGLADHLLALPPLVVLSFFPIYHRNYDGIILLISLPMIEMALRSRKALGVCLALTTGLFLSDVLVMPMLKIAGRFWNLNEVVSHKVLFILLERPCSLELLVLFVLYLVTMRALSSKSGDAARHPVASRNLPLAASS